MRVVIDISGALGAPSGLRRYIEQLLRGFSEVDSKTEFLMYACFWSGYPDAVNRLNLPKAGNFRLLLRRLPQRLVLPVEERLRRGLQESWLLRRNPNVFHGAGNILPRLRRLPSVLTFHHAGGEPDVDSRWNRFYFGELPRRSCLDAGRIIAVSEHTKRELLRRYGIDEAKVRVIWEGGPSPEMVEGTHDAPAALHVPKPYILFVSAINARKNLLALIRAFAELVAGGQYSHDLILVGRREASFGELAAEAERLGVARKVRFLDSVGQSELFSIYRGADLFVYPSLMEGFGLPLIEAMACSVPVIAARAAALPEIASDAALFFDGQNPKDLAEKMSAVLSDPALRQELVAKGLRRARIFDWKETARKTLEVYDSASQNHAP